MDRITSINELNRAIFMLESKQIREGLLLKEQFKITFESIQPINLIQSTLKELAAAPNLKNDLLNTTVSLTVGYLSKKAAIGNTSNPFKKLLGRILQLGVTGIVANNSNGLKSVIMGLVKSIKESYQKKTADELEQKSVILKKL